MRTAAVLATLLIAGCGSSAPDADEAPPARQDASGPPAMAHVHGVGVDGGRVLVATHEGLLHDGQRVGAVQDLMGFTVARPGELLASGHPGPQAEGEPGNLGLLRSVDGGRTWRQVSLRGEADFHVLAAGGDAVYGFDGASGRLLASADRGRTWKARMPPGSVLSLAVDPDDERRVVASTSVGLAASPDRGATWRLLDAQRVGLLAWSDDLHLAAPDGALSRSEDGGRTWSPSGAVGGAPVALAPDGAGVVAALEDGTVRRLPGA